MSIAEVRLRPGTAADAAVAAGLQRRASLAGLAHIFPPDEYPFPAEAVRERWAEALADPASAVFLAEVADAPVGVAAAREGWLDGLYVDPDQWGTTVASVLHDAVLEHVHALRIDSCRLWVLEHNERARRFYERRGWVLDGTTRVVPFPPHPLDLGYSISLVD